MRTREKIYKRVLEHLKEDYNQLVLLFPINYDSIGSVNIESTDSDSHNNAQHVCILTFSDGLKIVYKPHEMSIDVAWLKFLLFLKETYKLDLLVRPNAITFDDHGWCDYIDHNSIAHYEKIGLYYYRCGLLLCVLYLLGSCDLHGDNLIAYGEYPVIIDTETLLTGVVKSFYEMDENYLYSSSHKLQYSVVGTALLPKFKLVGESLLVDYGGFSGILWNSKNMPKYQNCIVRLNEEYEEKLIKGFSDAYDVILKSKERIVNSSEFQAFSGCRVRMLIRNTQSYSALLEKIQATESEYKKEILLGRLANAYMKTTNPAILDKLLAIYSEERKQLERGDIPYFYLFANKTDLYTSGRKIYEEYLIVSPIDNATQKIMTMSIDEKNLQVDIIRSAFYVYNTQMNNDTETEVFARRSIQDRKIDDNDILDEIIYTYDSIKTMQLATSKTPDWIVYQNDPNSVHCGVGSIGIPLYAGAVGIAVFVGALGFATSDTTAKQLSIDIYSAYIEKWISQNKPGCMKSSRLLGWGNGVGGILKAMHDIFIYTKEPSIKRDIDRVLLYVLENEMNTNDYDVLCGISGLLCVLDCLEGYANRKLIIDVATKYGNILLNARHKWFTKLLWLSNASTKPLTGYGHGMSGVATACRIVYEITKNPEYVVASETAFQYEVECYDNNNNAWPDYRYDTDGSKHMYGWCSGGPGIGLAQRKVEKITKIIPTSLIDYAEKSIICAGILPYDNLCCGNSAVIDYYIESEKSIIAKNVAASMIVNKNINGNYSLTGYHGKYIGNLSLFQGITGIAYEFLRILYPEKVKSVLV